MSDSQEKKLLAEREARVFDLLQQGKTADEIRAIEGIDERTEKLYRREAKRQQLPIKSGKRDVMPFGLTEQSTQFRTKLASIIYAMLEHAKWHRLEIARHVGLTQREQGRMKAKTISYYDWKLTEIERLATVRKMPFRQFMLELLKPGPNESREVKEEWNRSLQAVSIGSSAGGSTHTRP